jgi:hypothetical protein
MNDSRDSRLNELVDLLCSVHKIPIGKDDPVLCVFTILNEFKKDLQRDGFLSRSSFLEENFHEVCGRMEDMQFMLVFLKRMVLFNFILLSLILFGMIFVLVCVCGF